MSAAAAAPRNFLAEAIAAAASLPAGEVPPLFLVYDTETSGLPKWSMPSEHPSQPHIIQLAARLVCPVTREIRASMTTLIKPEGWECEPQATAIHGITTERAMAEGIPEAEALEAFIAFWQQAEWRVGHEESFDARMIRIAQFRFGRSQAELQAWKEGAAACTCWSSLNVVRATKANGKGIKKPTLSEAYEFLLKKPLEGAHDAGSDTDAALAIYFALLDYAAPAPAPIDGSAPIAVY